MSGYGQPVDSSRRPPVFGAPQGEYRGRVDEEQTGTRTFDEQQLGGRRTDRSFGEDDQPQYSMGRPVNQVRIEAYDSRPSPLTMYLVAALGYVSHAVKSVVTDSTFNTAAAAIGFAAAKISFFGVAGPQAAALVLTASIVHSVVRPTIENALRIYHHTTWSYATVALNTAVITLAVATYLGIAIPAAKGLVLAAGVTALVKYAQIQMSENNESLMYRPRTTMF